MGELVNKIFLKNEEEEEKKGGCHAQLHSSLLCKLCTTHRIKGLCQLTLFSCLESLALQPGMTPQAARAKPKPSHSCVPILYTSLEVAPSYERKFVVVQTHVFKCSLEVGDGVACVFVAVVVVCLFVCLFGFCFFPPVLCD